MKRYSFYIVIRVEGRRRRGQSAWAATLFVQGKENVVPGGIRRKVLPPTFNVKCSTNVHSIVRVSVH